MYLADTEIYPPMPVRHIVSVSSGAPSALLALKVIEKYGAGNVDCIFADTLAEHHDNYRFLYDLQQRGMEIIFITRGKTPEDLQREQNTLFTQALAPCTRILKLEPIREFVAWRQAQGYLVHMHIGMTIEDRDSSKTHSPNGRLDAPFKNWLSVGVWARYLLVDEGHTRDRVLYEMQTKRGYKLPISYAQNFPNANCLAQGGCVKGGKKYMQRVLQEYPDAYAKREKLENDILTSRAAQGKNTYTHLREAAQENEQITLTAFRERYEAVQGEPMQLKLFTLDNDMAGLCGTECGVMTSWQELDKVAA
jgi:hypothetical protein